MGEKQAVGPNHAHDTEFLYRAYIGQHVIQCFAKGEDVPRIVEQFADDMGLAHDPQLFVPYEIDPEDETIALNDYDYCQPPSIVEPETPYFRNPRKIPDMAQLGLPMRYVDSSGVTHILGF